MTRFAKLAQELVAVASRDSPARAYADDKGIPKAHGSYEALLADADVDVVYISLPNALHCEWTVKAAQAGKHVLIEKPAAVTLDELDRMNGAASTAGVTVFEAFMYLHHSDTHGCRHGASGLAASRPSAVGSTLPAASADSSNIRLSAGLTEVHCGTWASTPTALRSR